MYCCLVSSSLLWCGSNPSTQLVCLLWRSGSLTADLSIDVRGEGSGRSWAPTIRARSTLIREKYSNIFKLTPSICKDTHVFIEDTRSAPRTKKSSSRLQLLACGKTTNSNTNHAHLLHDRINMYHSKKSALRPYLPCSEPRNVEYGKVFCGNAIYGYSGLGNCLMLNSLSIAFSVIDLINMLIRWIYSVLSFPETSCLCLYRHYQQ